MQMILGLALNLSLGAILFGFFQGGIDLKGPGNKALAAQNPGNLSEDLRRARTSSDPSFFANQGGGDFKLLDIMGLAILTQENFKKISDALGR